MLNTPGSRLVRNHATGNITSTIKLGSCELTSLGAGVIEDDEGLAAALSKPTIQRAVEEGLVTLYREGPFSALHCNIFRNMDVALQVANCSTSFGISLSPCQKSNK